MSRKLRVRQKEIGFFIKKRVYQVKYSLYQVKYIFPLSLIRTGSYLKA